MIYTDNIHIVADSLRELHNFCAKIGIKRCWYEGYKKGHPHYDIPKFKQELIVQFVNDDIIELISPRLLLTYSKNIRI